ncbi:disease resistance protein PIK6-NP-like [Panicum virgatum]|uniref:disease resistance protein PIK6-NP-like n=1 Tax=Panicum virgatum TaxID=38727 RepID=UPI0019D54096|nr:disease resistance protein PIK6-NP-like [Panicum virgatum]
MELAVGASAATLKSLLSKLGSLLAEQYTLIRGVRGDIQFITDELASMQAFLSNLSKCKKSHDDQTEDWIKQIRDVTYDIEDCIDGFAHRLRPDPRGSGWLTTVRRTLYEIRTWYTRRNVAAQITDLKNRAEQIGNRRRRYGVRDPEPGKGNGLAAGLTKQDAADHQEITCELVRIKQPVGPDVEHLGKWIADNDMKKLRVLSVVGYGGMGKTTIATEIYRRFGPQFDCRAMVTVSQNSDPEIVWRNILSQLKQQAENGVKEGKDSSTDSTMERKIPVVGSILSCLWHPCRNEEDDGSTWQGRHGQNHQQIQAELRSYLKQKRYLLLIDDVWSESSWLYIKKCFPENEQGSRVIVTTRIQAVAATCSPRDNKELHLLHPVKLLDDEEAKDLFQKTLEECKGAGYNQLNHRQVPDRVWKMCGGLPLAIVTMAGLVASDKQQGGHKDWNEVCESLFPEKEVCHKPEDFMRIINHSYHDLDSDLKTCSLYLSIFPKGRKISMKRLTRRWIAEGFVSEKQGLSVEVVAETCFNQLIERKLIRPVEHNSSGRVKSCQVHDMVLEYLISKAAEEDFVTVVGSHWSMPAHSNKVRRLSVHSSDSKRAQHVDSMNLSHVRSLTVFESLDKLHFKSLKTGMVQVLDLQGCRGFRESHVKVSDMSEMVLLKYLCLRRTDVKNLPRNIHKLEYLETIDIRETEVQRLPATVGKLKRIKNILGGDKRARKTLKLPREFKGTTRTLRILSGVEIAEGSTTAASDLNYFTGLRKLAIYKIHKSEDIFKDLLSSIQYLSGYSLQTLKIDDESSEFHKTLDSMSSYPTDLSTLELSGMLLKLPTWIKELNRLVKLTLSATALRTDNLKVLSNLGSLFSLTFSISEKEDPALGAIVQKNKSESGGKIFFPAGEFSKLKLFRIFVPLLPLLHFSRKAAPQLERIELRFKRFEGLNGIDNLISLNDVLLTVDGKRSEPTKSILHDLKKASVSSKYTLIVNEAHD